MPRPKKQFSRPSIQLAVPEEKREWRDALPGELGAGDLIPDYGLVIGVADSSTNDYTTVRFKNGTEAEFKSLVPIFAFTRP